MKNTRSRRGIRLTPLLIAGLLLLPALTAVLAGMEPPTRAEIEKYKRDGTWSRRQDFALQIGNHRLSEEMAARLRTRLHRSSLEQQGLSSDRVEALLAPPPAWRGMPTRGTVKMLALLLSFSDHPETNTTASIESKLFGEGSGEPPTESLRSFYRRSSYGQLDIQGNVLGWYNTGRPRPDITDENDFQTREGLIKEALTHFNATGHDFSQYDNDGDGSIDCLTVIWSGPDNGWGNFWWGYQTDFSDRTFTLDGKRLRTYSWQWESRPLGTPFTPATVIHETGHALGLPDYYDYDDTVGPNGGVGGLDQMDSYGDHNCFSKFLLDWITPTVYGSGSRTLTLSDSGTQGSAALFVPRPESPNYPFYEFFMVQNRFRSGNDIQNPADGLLVWHVDARLNPRDTDYLYDNSYSDHKLLRLQEADGQEEIENGDGNADAGDYYTAGRTFTPRTDPGSDLYDGTVTEAHLDTISANGPVMTCRLYFGGTTLSISVGAGGTTDPAPGENSFPAGSQVQVRAIPDEYCTFTGWSGDAGGTDNPLALTMDTNKSIHASFRLIQPPLQVAGQRQYNRSLSQRETIDTLSWQANPANGDLPIAGYRISAVVNGTISQLAEVDGAARTWQRRKATGEAATYRIAAVLADGSVGAGAETTVR